MYLSFRVDSIMLLENNFQMTSTDASDKMLKQAWKIRWQRRKEEAFDNWGKLNDATNKLYIVLVSKHILVLPNRR